MRERTQLKKWKVGGPHAGHHAPTTPTPYLAQPRPSALNQLPPSSTSISSSARLLFAPNPCPAPSPALHASAASPLRLTAGHHAPAPDPVPSAPPALCASLPAMMPPTRPSHHQHSTPLLALHPSLAPALDRAFCSQISPLRPDFVQSCTPAPPALITPPLPRTNRQPILHSLLACAPVAARSSVLLVGVNPDFEANCFE
ncbi:hypothetical protein SLEP1_g48002 [Rubroshorea leprosula]|uniref:Uncharacterized protein n=1 Tax=Rubroshorea leprosula TaxID=152421 RepID=A0AAV5LSA3_9ROSI|nr:hypothetical protein SLEP1_g48002 [Rubroshorea leprosula]